MCEKLLGTTFYVTVEISSTHLFVKLARLFPQLNMHTHCSFIFFSIFAETPNSIWQLRREKVIMFGRRRG